MSKSIMVDLLAGALVISAILWIFGPSQVEKNKKISRLLLLLDAEEDPIKKESIRNELRALQ